MARLFTFKDEEWWDLKAGTVKMWPTIRPYRRRSWTETALRAAWAFLMEQESPEGIRVSGSNSVAMAIRLGLMKAKRRCRNGTQETQARSRDR